MFLVGVYKLKGGLFDNRMRTLLSLLKGSWSWTQEGHIWSMGLILKVPLICGTSFGWLPELEMCVAPEVSIFYWFVNVKHEWMSREVIGRYKIKNIEYLLRNCRLSIPLCQIQDMQWSVSPKEVGHETTCSSFSLKFWYSTLSALFNSYFSNEFY